ncbi:MAG: DUF1648 domain-containing protein [Candidatus Micrarchaeia archaeon]
MRKSEMVILAVVILSFLLSVYFYPRLPESIASHWNMFGEADGYTQKFWGVLLMPFVLILLLILFILIPKIDPLKANIQKFREYYENFMVVVALFFLYIHFLMLLWNVDVKFNMVQLLTPALAVLLYYSGVVTENAKRNWFIGIQTPWTLSSERVWNKTHKLGGKLLKIVALISLIGILLPPYAIFLLVLPLLLVTIYIVFYSYQEYQKEAKRI